MILAGDVGGTKIHLALVEQGASQRRGPETRLATADVASLPETLAAFAAASPVPLTACVLGVAGPVLQGEVPGSNLPWVVRAADLEQALGVPVTLLNDLEAAAHGLDGLEPADLRTIQEGDPLPGANRALLSPGTGLGESILAWCGNRTLPIRSEGGHADFAARTDEEIDLLRHLRARWGRVSVERVVSGPGLVNVFCWLRDSGRARDDSGLEASPGDSAPAAAISRKALDESSAICREALRVWVGALAAHAGGLVLRGHTLGGLFLGGGIPPQILPALRSEEFRAILHDKAPRSDDLVRVPVHVVMVPDLTLRGAAHVALRDTAPR